MILMQGYDWEVITCDALMIRGAKSCCWDACVCFGDKLTQAVYGKQAELQGKLGRDTGQKG